MSRMLLKDAAKALGVSKHFLYTEARAGRIPHFRAGNRYIFDIEQVDEFLRQKALENVKEGKNERIVNYGMIRRIKA